MRGEWRVEGGLCETLDDGQGEVHVRGLSGRLFTSVRLPTSAAQSPPAGARLKRTTTVCASMRAPYPLCVSEPLEPTIAHVAPGGKGCGRPTASALRICMRRAARMHSAT
jgi:hypothetical protein